MIKEQCCFYWYSLPPGGKTRTESSGLSDIVTGFDGTHGPSFFLTRIFISGFPDKMKNNRGLYNKIITHLIFFFGILVVNCTF